MAIGPGTRLGRYDIVALLGAGGMGEVYRAHDSRLERDVALKVLPAAYVSDPERRARFLREARAAAALDHPNIISIHDVGADADAPFIVSELLEGTTLRERLASGAGWSPRKALEVAIPIARGLAAAHAHGIVHRDLKPENVFLSDDAGVKILDFGLARVAPEAQSDGISATSTEPGTVLGTIGYMAPEQVRGLDADHRADIFAFGAILYEMLAGRRAYSRNTPADTMTAILTEDPPEITCTTHPIPPALQQIIARCLEKRPDARFQSASDLAFALSALSDTESKSHAAAAGAPRSAARWLVPSLVALALAAGGVWVLLMSRTHAPPATVHHTAVPLTSFQGQEVAPSFSPDGSQVAFAWSPGGPDEFDLYVKVVGSEKPLRLTTHPARWIAPAWSPDGRYIAFSRVSTDDRGIYLIPALGGHKRKLTDINNPTFDYPPATVLSWSPDGRLLAFAEIDEPSKIQHSQTGIVLLDVETLRRRRLPDPSSSCAWVWTPAFSPDGTSVAVGCSLDQDVNTELYAVPVSGGKARMLAHVQGAFSGLTWTADGKEVLFVKDGNVWRVGADGGEAAMVLRDGGASWPVVSRQGNRLAYSVSGQNMNIWRVTIDDSGRPADAARKVVASSRSQTRPVLSPDGTRLVFESTRSGALEIWVSAVDGSDPVRLTAFQGPQTGSPRWSPDGRQIVFDSRASGRAEIYVVRADGGPPRRVVTGADESSEPDWSHDGRWLYFTARAKGRDQVWRITPTGDNATQLTHGGGYHARESPDGTRVYYVKPGDEVEIWSASVNGGGERPVPDMPRLNGRWYADWDATTNGIYFIDGSLPQPAIQFYDFTTRRVRRVAGIPGKPVEWAGGLAVSSDERTFFFSQVDEITSDIMLVENFR